MTILLVGKSPSEVSEKPIDNNICGILSSLSNLYVFCRYQKLKERRINNDEKHGTGLMLT